MTERWQIFRPDGSSLGPLSPLEVRDALRDGSIDPFDLVCRVGSKVKQPLVEVDEIFLSADEAEKGKIDSIYNQAGDLAAGMEETVSADVKKILAGPTPQPPLKQTQFSRPVAYQPERARPQPIKRHAKKYFIVGKKKRFHGPLSAPEIQSLFLRGLVLPNVSVSKNRNGPRIPVQQFVSAYMGAKAKKFNSESTKFNFEALAEKKGLPSSKEMEQWARTVAQQAYLSPQKFPYLSALLVAGCLVVLFLLAQFVIGHRLKRAPKDDTSPVQQEEVYEPMEVSPSSDLTTPKPEPVATPSVDAPKPLKEKSPKKTPRPPTRIRPARRDLSLRPQRVYTPEAPRAASHESKPLPSGYAAQSGQVITISGGTYAPKAVASCGLKCALAITDSRGLRVNVVFFKAQYEDVLKQKAGRASFTGRIEVQGGQSVLYLQNVR